VHVYLRMRAIPERLRSVFTTVQIHVYLYLTFTYLLSCELLYWLIALRAGWSAGTLRVTSQWTFRCRWWKWNLSLKTQASWASKTENLDEYDLLFCLLNTLSCS